MPARAMRYGLRLPNRASLFVGDKSTLTRLFCASFIARCALRLAWPKSILRGSVFTPSALCASLPCLLLIVMLLCLFRVEGGTALY